MPEANIVSPHMEVLGSDGGHVGIVDALEGGRIKLTKAGSDDGKHHYVEAALVQDIRGNTVTLTKPADAAIAADDAAPEPAPEPTDVRDLPDDPQAPAAH